MSSPKLRIAMLGIRGIPANYGGFETCVHEIAPRMVAQGHDVTVYCRTPHIDYPEDHYRGVRLVKLPTIQNKYLDTPAHSLISGLHALREDFDAVLVFGVGNSPVAGLLRLFRTPTAINVDGLDWTRDKWPAVAKVLLRTAARLAGKIANRTITDSRYVQHFYRHQYGVELDFIPYGASPGDPKLNGTLTKLGIEPNKYFLYVGRFEPENRVHELVEAAGQSGVSTPTVIVGDAPYADEYKQDLYQRANGKVHFAGAIYGDGYWELNHHAYAYVFPVASSGTHPALIEAMACGNCLLVQDTPDNRAVGGDAVRYFRSVDELAELMRWAVDRPQEVQALGKQAGERARELFNWDRVTGQYLDLAYQVSGIDPADVNAASPDRPALTLVRTDDTGFDHQSRQVVDDIAKAVFKDQVPGKLPGKVDAEAVRNAIAVHGVGPLLGKRVERGEPVFGGEVDDWLRDQVCLNRERQARLKDDLSRILAAFERDNIEAIPLKGTAMLIDRPDEIGWRPLADLDLLVRHEDQRAIDLAYAHAGYCLPRSYSTGLSGLGWKHLHYQSCDRYRPTVDAIGEHPDHPRDIESHPAVVEMLYGTRWDITGWITNNLKESCGAQVPDDHAMSLHLAVHCSMSILESKCRMVQIIDLARQLDRAGVEPLISAVRKSGIDFHARFVYPALALVARWTGHPGATKAVRELEPHLPPAMAEWLADVSFYDISWETRDRQPVPEDPDRWAISPAERVKLAAHQILPLPRDLAAAGYSGEGARAILGWYPRYYRNRATAVIQRD